MVMYLDVPGRNHSYTCVALFKDMSDTGPWCQIVWGALFSQKRGYQQGRIGFLATQHLSIIDYLEITIGSDTVEILQAAIMYIIAIYTYIT